MTKRKKPTPEQRAEWKARKARSIELERKLREYALRRPGARERLLGSGG